VRVPMAPPAQLHAIQGGDGRLLTVGGVAERLPVSTATIYTRCERGELPHVRDLQRHPDRAGRVGGVHLQAERIGTDGEPTTDRSERLEAVLGAPAGVPAALDVSVAVVEP